MYLDSKISQMYEIGSWTLSAEFSEPQAYSKALVEKIEVHTAVDQYPISIDNSELKMCEFASSGMEDHAVRMWKKHLALAG